MVVVGSRRCDVKMRGGRRSELRKEQVDRAVSAYRKTPREQRLLLIIEEVYYKRGRIIKKTDKKS